MMRRLRRRRWLRGAPLAFAALAVAPAALASSPVRIQSVDTSGFPLVHATVIAPVGASVPRLTENGAPTHGFGAVNLSDEKAIVLAIDRSESMRGAPLTSAVEAARSFAGAAGSHDHVGVVAFGRDAIALTRSSATAADAADALAGLTVDTHSGTALYDAVALAAHRLVHDDRPGRAIVVVTDGSDVSSDDSLSDAVDAAHRAHAAVYTIGIGGPSFNPGPLRQLARETGGSYHQATTAGALHEVYASLESELARTWQLSYVTALRPGARLELTASVAGTGSGRVSMVVPGGSGAATPPSSVIPAAGYSTLGTLVVAAICGFFVLLACCFWFASRRGDRVRARIEPHLGTSPAARKDARRQSGAAARAQIADGLERMLGDLRQFKSLQLALDRAALPLRAGELVAMCTGSGLFFGLVFAVFGSSPITIVLVMAVFGSLPYAYVSFKAGSRMRTFENQLPDLLITIAASLKAGHSFRQALQAVVEEGAAPASEEFRRVLTETQLGKPMDDALNDLGDRIGSKNLSFVINAVTIQRQVGGSLAGLFDMVADTVRQRQQFLRKVKGLTAMGRMSAYVLVGLPFFIAAVVTMMNPLYMSPLYHSSTGHTLILAGFLMIAVGSFMLKKIISFKG